MQLIVLPDCSFNQQPIIQDTNEMIKDKKRMLQHYHTRNQRKTDSPSSPPQYFLSTLSLVLSTATPTICRESNLGLPDNQLEFNIRSHDRIRHSLIVG